MARPIRCSRKGCHRVASWLPVLILPPPAIYQDASPAKARTSLKICAQHRLDLSVDDLVTDETWGVIAQAFAAMGYVEPDRDRLRVEFEPVPRNG